jgi:hypothetical protein
MTNSDLNWRMKTISAFHTTLTWWGRFLEWASGEWILTRLRRGNGGDVILLRSILIALLIYIPAKFLLEDPKPNITWFGAVFAGTYAALYARFSQQWQYMASLYNSIKTAEVRTAKEDRNENLRDKIAQWKAGFIEDAETLHLAMKPAIASIICIWGKDDRVKHWFDTYTIGNRQRLDLILNGAAATCEREGKKWRTA